MCCKLDGKRASSSSRTGNQECFSFLDLQQLIDSLVSGKPIDWKSSCMQGIERGRRWSDEVCGNSHIVGIMTDTDLVRRADDLCANTQPCNPSSHLFNSTS